MQEKDIYSELNSIRNLMERSAKFISLSGLSGILAGVYALIGAGLGYYVVYGTSGDLDYRDHYVNDEAVIFKLFLIAVVVLVLSLTTGILLTVRKAKSKGETVWNPSSKKLLVNMAIPLVTGGILILILLYRGYFGIIAPATLIFYGLALVAGSHYTVTDVKWLGIYEIVLGLIAACLPGFGIVFWTIGFGVLHIIYGSIMHFRYDR
jgi:formate/nitrite transporter FocA (FNT family)